MAQTKFSGTCACKRDQQQQLAVGDRPEHGLGVEQYKCNWTKPIDLGGGKEAKSKGTFTVSDGTGMHKGISGKGTFSCASTADGLSCDVDGEYQPAK